MTTAKIQSLRQAAEAPVSPPPRSPERAKLAASIERHDDAISAEANVEAAMRRAADFWSATVDAVTHGKRSLDEAREAAPRRLVERMLAGGEPTGGADDVRDSEATLARAEAQARDAQEARTLLDEELQRVRREVEWSGLLLREALGRAVAADPAIVALVARWEDMGRERASLALVMQATSQFHPPGYIWDAIRSYRDLDRSESTAWVAALEAMMRDADAALPPVIEVTVTRTIVNPNDAT